MWSGGSEGCKAEKCPTCKCPAYPKGGFCSARISQNNWKGKRLLGCAKSKKQAGGK